MSSYGHLMLVAFWACVSAAYASADNPEENGIYRLVETGGITAKRTGGGTVNLGQLIGSKFGKVNIESVSNDNERFTVTFVDAGPFQGSLKGSLAVNIAGVTMVVGSRSDLEPNSTATLTATVQARRLDLAANLG